MFDKSENKDFKDIYDPTNSESEVHCKLIVDNGSIINYLINIKDDNGGITILLDRDGNAMLSQVKL